MADWVLTLPAAMMIAGALYIILRQIFQVWSRDWVRTVICW
jgi:hypothetical protein